MSVVQTIEDKAAGWFKQAPHLPPEGRKWIAENAWWLALISLVVLGTFILLNILGAALLIAMYSGYGLFGLTSVLVSLGFLVAVIIILTMAISPLKALKKQGWDLIFLAVLVSTAPAIVGAVLTYSAGPLVGAALGLVIGGYFLFEVRDYFKLKRAPAKS